MKSTPPKPAADQAEELPRPRKRSTGRPSLNEAGVGREMLIDKTCELLRTLPPEKVTRVEVARQTNVDPSLIRYYFRDRSSLLVAAAERVSAEFSGKLAQAIENSDRTPISRLRERVRAMLQLNVNYPFYHRLITEIVHKSEAPTARKLAAQLTIRPLDAYAAIVRDGVAEGTLRGVDTTFLTIAIIGLCEFFVGGNWFLSYSDRNLSTGSEYTDAYFDFLFDILMNGVATPAGQEIAAANRSAAEPRAKKKKTKMTDDAPPKPANGKPAKSL